MGKPLSLDLRERVMGFIDEGHSCNRAARVFRISISSAIRIAGRKRATGSVSPARQGRPRGGGKLEPFAGFLRAQVPPGQKSQSPLYGSEIVRARVKKEFFNGIRRIADRRA